jgi:hypothetical protein
VIFLLLPSYFQLTTHLIAGRDFHSLLCEIHNDTLGLDYIIPNKKSTIHILYNVKLARNFGKASVGDVGEKDIQDNGFLRQIQLISDAFEVDRRFNSPFAR